MKSIIEAFPSNKKTGIYRIFITVGKHEFCYVSYADNIYGSIKEHKAAILKHFKFPDLTKQLIKNYAVPEKSKALFHFSIFIMSQIHKLTVQDIKYEILEKLATKEEFEIDKLEQKWIDKWQCEKYGFNTPFKYLEKFIEATMYNLEGKLEFYKKAWIQAQINIESFALHDQNHINKQKWFKNPTNAFILLDRGYIRDESNWFRQQWKNTFDNIKSKQITNS